MEAIKVLKARYFRAVDTKDWAALAELFCVDATLDAGVAVRDGVDAIVTTMSSALADVVSVHHGHMPEITVGDDRSATGIWANLLHLQPVRPRRQIDLERHPQPVRQRLRHLLAD